MIPKILHYCFGMSADAGGKPWSLVHHVCLRSAVERIRPTEVFLYCETEPSGPWWDLSRQLINVQKIKAPREIFGNPLLHFAHRADVVRLEVLLSKGGIYLDADVFVQSSFDPLLNHSTVLGRQVVEGSELGLCNAVILAEPEAPFLRRWHSEYRTFRSMGPDEFWDEHSVKLPLRLSKELPDLITILPPEAFFRPTYKKADLALIFGEDKGRIDTSCAYATHLWESLAWDLYLEHLTPGRVRATKTNFYCWAEPFLADLPDDYGAPPFAARLHRKVRQIKRTVRSAASAFHEPIES